MWKEFVSTRSSVITPSDMENVLVICSDYFSLPSLFVLLDVSSEFRNAILVREIWQSKLRTSGFKTLAAILSRAVIDVPLLKDSRRRIQETKHACMVCYKTRSPPVRVLSGSIRAMCMKCDADLLWCREDINAYINTLEWKPKRCSLYNKLFIAKRRHTRKHLYWVCQVKELCKI